MGIKHTFVSNVADVADDTQVRPSNWNADHTIDGDVDFNGHSITNSGNFPWVNIKADYGAVGDGVTDDEPAFQSFTDDYQGERVTLIIPPGEYRIADGHGLFVGIEDLVVEGHGAFVFNDDSFSFNGYFTVGSNLGLVYSGGDTYSALIDSVNPGSSVVGCKTFADASKFTVDQWVLVSGLALASSNWPPSPAYFEFRKVSAVNPINGHVTFYDKLEERYLDHWPSFSGFNPSTVHSGPAMLYRMDDDWGTAEFKGIEFPAPFVNFGFREVKFTDCEFWGAPNVTIAKKYTLERCLVLGGNRDSELLEFDKIVEDFIVKDCVFQAGILTQTANKRMYIENSDLGTTGIDGTPRFLHVVNSQMQNLNFGPRFAGVTENVLLEGCYVGSVGNKDSYRAAGDAAGSEKTDFTAMTNGTLTIPTASAVPWAVPGAVILPWNNAFQRWRHPPFRVMDVSESGGITSILTTLTDAEWADTGTFGDRLIPHPCINITVQNSRGCAAIESMSSGTPNSPLYTQFSKLFTHVEFDYPFTTAELRGAVREFRIDVIKPYTGTQPELWVGLFDVVDIYGVDPIFVIDARQEGRRVIYGNSGTQLGFKGEVAGNGGDYSDNFGDYVHFNGSAGDVFELTEDITGEDPETWPVIRITAMMDQGKVAYDRELEETSHPTFINVMDYGAFGDGSVDDTDAVQSAITDACARGSAVFFPAGSYKITDTLSITEPIKMFGVGKRNSIALGSVLSFNHTNTNCIEIDVSALYDEGLFFEDLTFVGVNQTVMQHCLVAVAGSTMSLGGLSRCQFNGFTGNVLYFQASGGVAPYYQSLSMVDVSCQNVGGFISSDNVTSGLIMTHLHMRNINVEDPINKTIAAQTCFFDFYYVREIQAQNIVYEPSNSNTSVFNLGGNLASSFYGLHIEAAPANVFLFNNSPTGFEVQNVTKIGGVWSSGHTDAFIKFAAGCDHTHVLVEDFNIYAQTIAADLYTNAGGTDNLVTVLSGPDGELVNESYVDTPAVVNDSLYLLSYTGDLELDSSSGIVQVDPFAVFNDGVYVDGELVLTEQSPAPSAPGVDGGVIYLEDNGAGKTRLMIKFNTGAAQQIAIQP